MNISIDNIVKKIQSTDQKYNYDEIFFDWIKSMFYAYANSCNRDGYKDREKEFNRLIEKHGAKTMQMFYECHAELVMLFEEKGIDDYLGSIHHQLGVHNKMKGQFFTPFHLAKMMAETQVSDVLKKLEEGKINLEKANLLLEDVSSLLKDSKKNIIDSSSNMSSTLENIKNISNDVADSTKLITENFIEKSTSIKKNVGGFISIIDTVLEALEIFSAYFRKK